MLNVSTLKTEIICKLNKIEVVGNLKYYVNFFQWGFLNLTEKIYDKPFFSLFVCFFMRSLGTSVNTPAKQIIRHKN